MCTVFKEKCPGPRRSWQPFQFEDDLTKTRLHFKLFLTITIRTHLLKSSTLWGFFSSSTCLRNISNGQLGIEENKKTRSIQGFTSVDLCSHCLYRCYNLSWSHISNRDLFRMVSWPGSHTGK